MEEILASIRKIIADDQMLPLTRPAPPRPAAPPPEAAPAVLDLPSEDAPAEELEGEPSAPAAPSMSDFEAAFAGLRPSFATPPIPPQAEEIPVQAPEKAAPAEDVPPAKPSTAEETALVSPATGASVSSAFNALATTMFLQNTSMVEEAIRDLLRPMLKQWLDDNLPTVVERLVRAEIERVARGGR